MSWSDYLEGVGMRFGPDVNAYTSFDETVYMLTLPTDSVGVIETGFEILRDWAGGIAFDSLEVERERGVVIEEWRLGQGAGARMRDKQFPTLFRKSRYAQRLPIGLPEVLRNFDHAALKRFYKDWYRPELMAVVAVGDFDPERIETLIREHFASLPPKNRARPRREFDVPAHDSTLYAIATDPEATRSSVSVYLKRRPPSWKTLGDYRRSLVEGLAGGILMNRLLELTQRPSAPYLDVSSFQGRFLRALSASVLTATVADGRVERGLRALLEEIERAAQHGFTASELEREKLEVLRRMEQRFAERDKSHSGGFAAEYVGHYLYGGSLLPIEAEYALHQRFLAEITLREVNAAAHEWLQQRNRVVLVNAPETPGVAVPTEAELGAVIHSVRRAPVAAYTEEVSDAPLVPAPPVAGEIVAVDSLPEIGATEWTLSNGVRVLLKPTEFRAEEVLLAARSPGGTSLVPDEDYIPALTATAAVQTGGIGSFDLIELQKRLAGKRVSVGANIGTLQEGISGVASPQDLETMLQLVYLYFTAPRRDSAAFLAYRERARESLRNRSGSPEAVWSDTLQVTLAQNHPRARPPGSAMFDELDLDRSLEIYRDRFADAGDFTFYLVGNFEPDSLRSLIRTWLGGLPSTGRKESWRDVGIEPPRGVVRKQVFRGVEPKSRTQIVFTGPWEWNRDNLYAIRSLAEVLQIRLREHLREELGGTYGVGVSGSGARDPDPRYQFSVGFGAAPERLEELSGVIWEQIDSIKVAGPTEQELTKVREAQRRERQTSLRENSFWISQMLAYDSYDWDPSDILRFEERVTALNAEMIQRAAQQFLNPDNYVQVSLYPEGWEGR